MGISLPGLASGIDSAAIIAATMDVERMPQNFLKEKVASAKDYVSVMTTLNGKAADLFTTADKQSKPEAFNLFTASSSSPALTVTASGSAAAGELDITVNAVAARHSTVTAPMASWPQSPASLTFSSAAGDVTVTADSDSLDDVVKAVNASAAGVTATKVSAGNGGFRLQFTARESGAAEAFTVRDAGGAEIPATVTRQGTDAQVTLYAGTAAEQVITSGSNTFGDLLAGVSVTVSQVTSTPATVSVAKNAEAVTAEGQKLVDAVNSVLGYIQLKSKVAQTTDADGKTVVTSGALTSDSLTRSVTQKMFDAAIAPVDGKSPATIGIELTREGVLSFDPEKFAAALAADPAGTEAMLSAVSGRLADAAKSVSDKYDGSITQKISGQDTVLRTLNDQIAGWDTRLAKREESLALLYARLEVSMSRLNSMMSGLAAQLDNLPTYGDNKK